MNVVALVQSGDTGPVKIVRSTDTAMQRAVARLQEGSVALLHIRAVLDGDERLELALRRAWTEQRGDRDWYSSEVLAAIPDGTPRLDLHDEARRVALLELRGMA